MKRFRVKFKETVIYETVTIEAENSTEALDIYYGRVGNDINEVGRENAEFEATEDDGQRGTLAIVVKEGMVVEVSHHTEDDLMPMPLNEGIEYIVQYDTQD